MCHTLGKVDAMDKAVLAGVIHQIETIVKRVLHLTNQLEIAKGWRVHDPLISTAPRCLGPPPTKAAISPLLLGLTHFSPTGGIRCTKAIPRGETFCGVAGILVESPAEVNSFKFPVNARGWEEPRRVTKLIAAWGA